MSVQKSIKDFFKSQPNTPNRNDRKENSLPSTPVTSARKSALAERTVNQTNSSARKRKLNDEPRSAGKSKAKKIATSPQSSKLHEYDIVWARLDGYPYWPAFVCTHLGVNDIYKSKGSTRFVNVQFFEDDPKRAWIRESECLPLTNSKHPKQTVIKDPKLSEAIEMAVQALQMNKSDRQHLMVEFVASDEDENQEEEEEEKDEEEEEEEDDDEDEKIIDRKNRSKRQSTSGSAKKRRVRLLSDSDDSMPGDDDYKPGKDAQESSSEDELSAAESDEIDVASELSDVEMEEELEQQPMKKSSRTKGGTSAKKNLNRSKLNRSSTNNSNEDSGVASSDFDPFKRNWPHKSYDFLLPKNRKDKNQRSPDDPMYDKSTLFVPKSFLDKQTPALRQWWEIKSNNFDKIIFFKMGKFYELYHMDAEIIVDELKIVFMKGEVAHAGFPESSYGHHFRRLIDNGHTIVRVEQTETPQGRAERNKGAKKADKVVTREVCGIVSKGTLTSSVLNGNVEVPQSSFCLALVEKVINEDISTFGICFVDCSIGRFYIGQFEDDKYFSKLRSLFAHCNITEIVYTRNAVTKRTLTLLRNCIPDAMETTRSPAQSWNSRSTLKYVIEREFFKKPGSEDASLPEALLRMLDPMDILHLTPASHYELALSAWGTCLSLLNDYLIDEELVTLGLITEYTDISSLALSDADRNADTPIHMVLDDLAVKNLEIFTNSIGGLEGTLMNTIDFCVTKMGKRYLRTWLNAPLCNQDMINRRLDAVEELIRINFEDIGSSLKNLPDLQRMLTKMHTQGLARKSKDHPDSRAVMFEMNQYNKRKIKEFLNLIAAFRTCQQAVQQLNQFRDQFKSQLILDAITGVQDGGSFPEIEEDLRFFQKSFDHQIARDEGKVVLLPNYSLIEDDDLTGEDPTEKIALIEDHLETYLKKQTPVFGVKIKWAHTQKQPYMLEVPTKLASKASKEYELQSTTKTANRFYTPRIKELLAERQKLLEKKELLMQQNMRLLFARFDRGYHAWDQVVKCISILDCLMSLATYAKLTDDVCRPTLLPNNSGPRISIKEGKHPALLKINDNFISNDITLNDQLLLVTGPNMGGKSTLMRQTGLIVIMAQIGSFVPAQECELTLTDRVFTRLGASDRILQGESTFYVELSECSTILKNSSKSSLILLDELGRGTSTFDGTAIASAVVRHISNRIQCPTIFSTHYHSLIEDFCNTDRVLFKHMACQVENENASDPTEESITFLYKLVDGVCPKSYGFNAALLANISKEIVKRGFERARQAEQLIERQKLVFKLVHKKLNPLEMRQLLAVR